MDQPNAILAPGLINTHTHAAMSLFRGVADDLKLPVPLYNVYSQLVYSLKASDVGDVMVNGRMIVRSRHMLTVDDKAVMAKAEEYRAQVSKSLSGK